MWWMMLTAQGFEVHPQRFRLEPTTVVSGGATVPLQGYAYAIQDEGECVGIAVDGPSSTALPQTFTDYQFHEVDQALVFDVAACALLVRKIEPEPEPDDIEMVVVKSKKRDRSLRRLRASLTKREAVLHAWGLSPQFLDKGQRMVELRHADGSGQVDAVHTTGWTTLIDDPYQQVEFGASALVLESSFEGDPRVLHRRTGARRGVVVSKLIENVTAVDNGPAHTLTFHARFEAQCVLGPCDHLSLLMPVVYEERVGSIEPAMSFALGTITVDGAEVDPIPGAFGRSGAQVPIAYRAYTLPLPHLETEGSTIVSMKWTDRLELTHPVLSPKFNPNTQEIDSRRYVEWFDARPGPERAEAMDVARPEALQRQRAAFDVERFVTIERWSDERWSAGARPRPLAPVLLGQPQSPNTEIRLARNGTGLPIWLHGDDLQTSPELHIARSSTGGPWLGAGRYKAPVVEGGLTQYYSDPFNRASAGDVAVRARAYHQALSAQLGPRDLSLALFQGPMITGVRTGYGAFPGVGWFSPAFGGGSTAVKPDDRALIYATAHQWFDRPTATLEPWLQRAFTELYADLLFEGVFGAEAAGTWRRHPDPFKQKRFADFGVTDWEYDQQLAYATRALELLRITFGPRQFNKAVQAMLSSNRPLSAELFARHFTNPGDQRLVRYALVDGLCPTIEARWERLRGKGTRVTLTSDFTDRPVVVPVFVRAKNLDKGSFTQFVKLREGKGEFRITPQTKVTQVRIDPFGRLPLCGVKVSAD